MSQAINLRPADERAFAEIVEHHAQLRAEFDERVRALRAAVADSTPYEPALSSLRAFLADSVLPHASAEEAILYAAARGQPRATIFIQAMILEHRSLAERTRTLAHVQAPFDALAVAEGAAAVFALHVAKENELLLPALARAPGASLSALLRTMQQRLGELDEAASGTIGRSGEGRQDRTEDER